MTIEQARINMLKQQIRTWGVTDQKLLEILASTPREEFVPSEFREVAFADTAIPLAFGQVMFAPSVEARLLQELNITESDNVLEVGTGSGYLTALLARCAKHVHSVDINAEFTQHAEKILAKHHINNVSLVTGDASQGWQQNAPYDVIVVTGSLPHLVKSLAQELELGGRLFAIIGQEPTMEATLLERLDSNTWSSKKLFETVTPPLQNAPALEKFEF